MSNKRKRHISKLRDQAYSRGSKWIGWLEKEIERLSKAKHWLGKRVGRSTRARVMCRDGGCIVCSYIGELLTIHHVLPKREGGSNHIDNLVCLCNDCHTEWNQAEESGDWQWFEFYRWAGYG